jgi:uncharacterized membrane protein
MSGGRGESADQASLSTQRLGLLGRFVIYGLIGWCIECFFTSVLDVASGAGDLRLKGYSYLWMHPIWGAGLLLGERATLALQQAGLSRWTRAMVGMAGCFAVEYVTGALLVALIGRCPWDYSASPWNVNGLIRLDYAPFWLMCGWLYEPLGALIRRIHIGPEVPEVQALPRAEPQAPRALWPSGVGRAALPKSGAQVVSGM